MIIDFHTHIFPPRIKENREQYLKKDPCFSLLYSQPHPRMATAEELVEAMGRSGVDVSVALNITWAKEELCRETNDYVMESVARYAGKLVGFASLPPRPEAALRELERCVKGGMRGVGEVRGDMPGFALRDNPLWEAVMPELARHGLILLLHTSEPVGHPYPGKGSLTPEVVYPFLVRYPQVDVVCAHWGGGLPFYALMPEVAQALSRVYVDTAATLFLYQPAIYLHAPPLIGIEKVLFGSDFPLISPDRALAQLQGLKLKQSGRERILGQNARHLLFPKRR